MLFQQPRRSPLQRFVRKLVYFTMQTKMIVEYGYGYTFEETVGNLEPETNRRHPADWERQ